MHDVCHVAAYGCLVSACTMLLCGMPTAALILALAGGCLRLASLFWEEEDDDEDSE